MRKAEDVIIKNCYKCDVLLTDKNWASYHKVKCYNVCGRCVKLNLKDYYSINRLKINKYCRERRKIKLVTNPEYREKQNEYQRLRDRTIMKEAGVITEKEIDTLRASVNVNEIFERLKNNK